MSFENAQTAFAEAAAAFRQSDYTLAIDRLLEAQAYLSAVPDARSRSGPMYAFGREVGVMLDAAREREATAGARLTGIQRTKIEYVATTGSGDGFN